MPGKETILVVDDDESWLDLCKSLLTMSGYEAEGACSPGEALRKVEKRAFDIVLTDLCMPEPDDGRKVVVGVKSRWPDTDVILMTASPTLDSAIGVLKDGAYDYILKPFKEDYLKAVIDRCLEKRRSKEELGVERQLREELQAAYDEAKRLEKLKEGFLARISHELHTPLAQASLALSLLDIELPKEGKARSRLQNADVGITRLKEVIEDLLDFVDIQRPDLELERRPVSIPELFERIREGAKGLLEAKRIKVEAGFPEGLPRVDGDEKLLERAFRQLFLNAIHFNTQEGVIELTAQAWEDRVMVHVADKGEGIPPGEKQRAFDPFYQIADYMTRKVGGLGLGLAITKKIVEAHGGSITVDSEPGKGSDFKVALPQAG